MNKSTSLFALLFTFLSFGAQAQFDLNKASEKLLGSSSSLSQEDAAKGIKEALTKGIEKGVEQVAVTDGYFKNSKIKIPLPENATIVEKKLRAVGLGSQVDDAILSLNRAAENAANEAKPIFVNAIKQLSFQDAVKIIKGNDDAATQYLNTTTTDQLTEKFKPIIKASLAKVNATKYWNTMMSSYNKIPFVQKVNPDLEAYVTQKAIEGLFVMVAKEEKLIRDDPAARTTDILKKVFN